MDNHRYTLLKIALASLLALLGAIPGANADAPRGWIVIPDIGLYKSVSFTPIENRDYDLSSLGHGVTHLAGTTWVDDGWGRVVIAGHNPGGFSTLGNLNVGDPIIVVSHYGTTTWEVVEKLIVGNEIVYLNPTKTFTLTLITCLDEGETWLVINAKVVVQ